MNQRLQVQNAIVDYAAEIPELVQAGSNMAAKFYRQAENMPTNTKYSEIESRELTDDVNSAGNLTEDTEFANLSVNSYSEIEPRIELRRSPRRGLLEQKECVAKAFSAVKCYIEDRKWAKTV
ncbi:hypothetical protein BDR26DRAFT_921708 [Obelidium mucronatum]|nr:hypothetical protein BDR26DRAFT_921708 [Obelidium mucronatum]